MDNNTSYWGLEGERAFVGTKISSVFNTVNLRFLSAIQIEIKLLHIWVFNSDVWSLVGGIDIPLLGYSSIQSVCWWMLGMGQGQRAIGWEHWPSLNPGFTTLMIWPSEGWSLLCASVSSSIKWEGGRRILTLLPGEGRKQVLGRKIYLYLKQTCKKKHTPLHFYVQQA